MENKTQRDYIEEMIEHLFRQLPPEKTSGIGFGGFKLETFNKRHLEMIAALAIAENNLHLEMELAAPVTTTTTHAPIKRPLLSLVVFTDLTVDVMKPPLADVQTEVLPLVLK